MNYYITFLILLFAWPVTMMAQPLKNSSSETENSPVVKADQSEITKADLIQPVLDRKYATGNFNNSLQQTFTEKPALALLSSAILPGSGQLINNNWIRGGIYAALEITSVYLVLEYNNRGQQGERRYKNYADQNWSVTQYAEWLVDYHENNTLENPALGALEEMLEEIEGPAFDTSIDWENIDIEILREVERKTPFITPDNVRNSNFSHILPGYGSQQYYELISKYYQYQAGWKDYYAFHESNETNPYRIAPSGNYSSPQFYEGADLARQFNSDYRFSKNIFLLLVANHVVSAFDSYFTFQLKQNRLQAATSMAPNKFVTLKYHF